MKHAILRSTCQVLPDSPPGFGVQERDVSLGGTDWAGSARVGTALPYGTTPSAPSRGAGACAVDASTRADRALARGGVHAGRVGAALAHNLGAALATWKEFSAQGWWLWWFKKRIDRRFMARYSPFE